MTLPVATRQNKNKITMGKLRANGQWFTDCGVCPWNLGWRTHPSFNVARAWTVDHVYMHRSGAKTLVELRKAQSGRV